MTLHEFDDPADLAEALADRLVAALAARQAQETGASLAVSGGATPAALFRALSRRTLDWPRIDIWLVDDRVVPEDSPRSNARLVRNGLLQGAAAAARFTPPAARPAPTPHFAAVVLGMGADGHTASWFPGGDTLAAALDDAAPLAYLPLSAPGAGEPRLTLTLPAVLNADAVIVHIEGADKAAALARAQTPGPVEEMPVRAVLRQSQTPLEIWRAR